MPKGSKGCHQGSQIRIKGAWGIPQQASFADTLVASNGTACQPLYMMIC